jgi:hypothetical protein
MFVSAYTHPVQKNWREHASTCFKFVEGDQLTSEELAELKLREQPPTVENEIKVVIERIMGEYDKFRVKLNFKGRNYPQDEIIGNTLTDMMTFIKQTSNYRLHEKAMFEDGNISGMGVLEVYVDINDMLEPEIKIRHVDCFDIYPDPYSRCYDWNEDARFICRAKWVELNDAISLYPEYADELEGLINYSPDEIEDPAYELRYNYYVDKIRKRLRLVEIWYKILTIKRFIFLPDGSLELYDAIPKKQREKINGKVIEKNIQKIKVGVFCFNILLEHKNSPHGDKYFPFIPYFVYRKKDGEPYAVPYNLIDPQKEINKRRSKALHLLTVNQAMYEENAIGNKAEFATELARPDGLLEIRKGYWGKVEILRNVDLAQTQVALLQESKQTIERLSMIGPEARGLPSEVRSGIGIARKQAMTGIMLSRIFSNLIITKHILYNVLLEFIKQYYNESKVFYITDSMNAAKAINWNENVIKAIKESIYDVVITEVPDMGTLQQEQFQMLSQILPQIIQFGPGWAKILIMMSDLRNKEEILKQVDVLAQKPPLQPKISLNLKWEELTSEEKAAFAAAMDMQTLTEIEAHTGVQPKHITKAQVDLKRTHSKEDIEIIKQKAEIAKEIAGKESGR